MIPEYRLVVDEQGCPAAHVVVKVEIAAEMRVPPEHIRVVAGQQIRFELEVVPGKEFDVIDGAFKRLWTGLLCECWRCDQEDDQG